MDPRSEKPRSEKFNLSVQLLILFFGLHLSLYIYVLESLLHPICYAKKAFWHPFLATLWLKKGKKGKRKTELSFLHVQLH